MEERMSLREAFGAAWGNLTGINNEGAVRGIRALFFLIFIGGTAWAGWSYIKAQKLLEPKEYYPTSDSTAELETDKRRLDTMIDQVKTVSESRNTSSVMADNMQNLSKYIFADPTAVIVEPPPDPTRPDPIIPEIVIDPPPEIVLRGIMLVGKQQVAVMDISGVGSGMIVKVGDTFMQKKGRIVRISADKVVVRWGGRNWDIAPSF